MEMVCSQIPGESPGVTGQPYGMIVTSRHARNLERIFDIGVMSFRRCRSGFTPPEMLRTRAPHTCVTSVVVASPGLQYRNRLAERNALRNAIPLKVAAGEPE